MYSVRDICGLLKSAKVISLVWDGNLHSFNPNDEVLMGAFGDYAVKEIESYRENEVGLLVATSLVKAV